MPSKTVSSFHVDTNYLIDFFRAKYFPEEPTCQLASGVINEEVYHGKVKASVIVIGEFVDAVVKKKHSPELLTDLADFIEDGKLEVCYVEAHKVGRYTDLLLKVRHEVQGEDVGSTDVLILAHCMTDIDCKGLLTFDDDILTSKGIKKVLQEHVRNRRRPIITDDPRKRSS